MASKPDIINQLRQLIELRKTTHPAMLAPGGIIDIFPFANAAIVFDFPALLSHIERLERMESIIKQAADRFGHFADMGLAGDASPALLLQELAKLVREAVKL